MNNLMIETHNLTRIYGDGEEIRALDGVTLSGGESFFSGAALYL